MSSPSTVISQDCYPLPSADLRDLTDDPSFWDSAPDWGPAS